MEMNDETKELHIKQIRKYNKHLNFYNCATTIACVLIGSTAIYLVVSTATGTIIESHFRLLNMAYVLNLISGTCLLITSIIGKAGIRIKIKDIAEIFTNHGLSLEDEIANSKGRGKK